MVFDLTGNRGIGSSNAQGVVDLQIDSVFAFFFLLFSGVGVGLYDQKKGSNACRPEEEIAGPHPRIHKSIDLNLMAPLS